MSGICQLLEKFVINGHHSVQSIQGFVDEPAVYGSDVRDGILNWFRALCLRSGFNRRLQQLIGGRVAVDLLMTITSEKRCDFFGRFEKLFVQRPAFVVLVVEPKTIKPIATHGLLARLISRVPSQRPVASCCWAHARTSSDDVQ